MTDTLRLDRPPAEVFDLLTEPEQLAVWNHAFDHAERLEEGPLAVGSRVRIRARVDGRPADLEIEVVDLRAPELLEVVGRTDAVDTRATVTVRATDEGSEVTATSHAQVTEEEESGVEPDANPAFADLGGSLLRGLEAAMTDRPSQEP